MREALYLPLPLHTKVYQKSVLAVLIPRAAGVLSAGVILILAPMGQNFLMATLLCVLLWLLLAFRVIAMYSRIEHEPPNEEMASVDQVR
jgi:hypothetical protein